MPKLKSSHSTDERSHDWNLLSTIQNEKMYPGIFVSVQEKEGVTQEK